MVRNYSKPVEYTASSWRHIKFSEICFVGICRNSSERSVMVCATSQIQTVQTDFFMKKLFILKTFVVLGFKNSTEFKEST